MDTRDEAHIQDALVRMLESEDPMHPYTDEQMARQCHTERAIIGNMRRILGYPASAGRRKRARDGHPVHAARARVASPEPVATPPDTVDVRREQDGEYERALMEDRERDREWQVRQERVQEQEREAREQREVKRQQDLERAEKEKQRQMIADRVREEVRPDQSTPEGKAFLRRARMAVLCWDPPA